MGFEVSLTTNELYVRPWKTLGQGHEGSSSPFVPG